MAKTRFKSKFLSRNPGQPKSSTSYKATLVWQWLDSLKPGADEAGIAIRAMKSRTNMPDRFPHRTYLINYMVQSGVNQQLATKVAYHLWNMYTFYRDSKKHETEMGGAVALQITPDDVSVSEPEPEFKAAHTKWLSR